MAKKDMQKPLGRGRVKSLRRQAGAPLSRLPRWCGGEMSYEFAGDEIPSRSRLFGRGLCPGHRCIVDRLPHRRARPMRISGRVKALSMAGGSAHIRINFENKAVFTERVTEAGDWRVVGAIVPARAGAGPGKMRRLRLHVFPEGGIGEVIWDDITATTPDKPLSMVRIETEASRTG